MAVGSSNTSTERAGVRVDRHIVRVYMLAGALCGLASLLDLSRFATTNVTGHTNDALAAVAGAVIGGTSLYGGRASVIGSVFGALLAVILQSGLIAVGLPPFYQLDLRVDKAFTFNRWKLVAYPGYARDFTELYDLQRDPFERTDVACTTAARCAAISSPMSPVAKKTLPTVTQVSTRFTSGRNPTPPMTR